MPFCCQCGNQVTPADTFCGRCGARQLQAAREAAPQPAPEAAPPPFRAPPPQFTRPPRPDAGPAPSPGADPLAGLNPRTAAILCYVPAIGWIAAIVVLASEK